MGELADRGDFFLSNCEQSAYNRYDAYNRYEKMTSRQRWWSSCNLCALIVLTVIALVCVRAEAHPADADPWTAADLVEPGQLAGEMAHRQGHGSPTILYVGFRTLFVGGHIAGSSFHGTASTEQGLADLKKFAATLPRDTNLVIYCGCCPFDHCPNIRPAFVALHGMGFTHLRVLVLPKSFAEDWADKGYPVEKGL